MTKNGMQRTRRENLKRLIDKHGGPTALAKILGLSAPSYVSQLASGNRPISEKTARKYEEQLGLSLGTLDTAPGESLPFAGTDHALIANVVRAVGEELGKTQLTPSRFAKLVAVAYEHAAESGAIDRAHIKNLIALLD